MQFRCPQNSGSAAVMLRWRCYPWAKVGPVQSVLLLASILIGCSTGSVLPPTPLSALETSLPVARGWTRVNFLEDSPSVAALPLSIVGNRVYWIAPGPVLEAVEPSSGKTRWRHRLQVPVVSGVGGDDALALVGTRDADVLALEATNGQLRWRTRVSSEALAAPQLGGGTVIAYCVDGKVFALDADSGRIRWQFDTQVPLLTLRGLATPRIVDDRVLIGTANGRVLALQLADGKTIWSTEVAPARGRSELERIVDVDAAPVVLGDTVYSIAYQGQVVALSLATGRVLWSRESSSAVNMAWDDEALYVTGPDGALSAVNRRGGEILWRSEALRYRYVTAAARVDNYLVVGDVEGYLHWIDRGTGAPVHRIRIDETPVTFGPIVHEARVYALTRGGVLDVWYLPNPSVVAGNANLP